jgi:putative signal transducing protein
VKEDVAMEMVAIAGFPTSAEAMLARNLLVENGIKAELADENTGDLFHLNADFGDVKLLVPTDNVEQAKKLLQEAHQHTDTDGEPDSDELEAG